MLPRDYTLLYWSLWIFALATLVVSRFTFLRDATEDTGLFGAFMVYAAVSWGVAIIANAFEGARLMSHLKQNYYELWRDIRGVTPEGRWKLPSWGAYKFLLDGEDFGDPVIRRLKICRRRSLYYIGTVFCSFPLVFIPYMLIPPRS